MTFPDARDENFRASVLQRHDVNFIYALVCPVENAIRYIGKANDCEKRLQSHLRDARNLAKNHRCARWIRELVSQGHKPTMTVLHCIADGADWQSAEKQCIAEYLAAGYQLMNTTVGGNGFRDISIESAKARRENISAGLSKAWETPEYRASRAAGRIVALNQPGVRAKMCAAMKLGLNRPKVRQKNAAAQKAAWARKKSTMTPEEYKKLCLGRKAIFWADPEFKARMIAHLQTPEVKAKRYATRDTPEGTAKRCAKLKAAWADPEARARRLAVMRSPEYKAKISAAGIAANARRKAAQQEPANA